MSEEVYTEINIKFLADGKVDISTNLDPAGLNLAIDQVKQIILSGQMNSSGE